MTAVPGGRGCDDWDRRSADGDDDQLQELVDLDHIIIEDSHQLLAPPSQQSPPFQQSPPSEQSPQLETPRRLPGNPGGSRRGGPAPDRRALAANNRDLLELAEEEMTDNERARVRQVVTQHTPIGSTGRLPGNRGGRRGGPDRRALGAHNRALVELPEEELTDDERARVRQIITLKLLKRMQANGDTTPAQMDRLTAFM